MLGYWYNYMLSGAAPSYLSAELLTLVFHHQSLISTLIDSKEAASYHQLMMSYACYPLYSLIKIVSNVIVDGFDVYWTQRNKGWSILFWSSCRWAWCNILDTVFCDLHVVLQWEYKFFGVILELHKVIIKQWTPYGVNFWYALHWWFVGNYWIPVKILGIYGEWVQIIPPYCRTHIALVNPTLPNF